MDIFQTSYTVEEGWLEPLPDYNSAQTLVLIFGQASFLNQREPFAEINRKYADSIITGCSTPAGVLDNNISKNGLVISITRFWDTRLRLATIEKRNNEENSIEFGSRLAEQINEDSLSAVLTFADSQVVNGSQYLDGIRAVLDTDVVVSGGLAAYCGEQVKSWVLKSGRPTIGAACVIGFYGNSVTCLSSIGSGWKAFGAQREITKAYAETLYELDGKPALQLYKNYLGEAANDLPGSGLLYPLSVWSDDPANNVVRSIMAVDEDEQSISFAGDIPEGSFSHLMYGTLENLIEGAEDAAENLPGIYTHSPGILSVVASCIGRLLVLGNDVEMEIDAILQKLPEGVRQIGFYSAGEFAASGNETYALQNETLTLTVIYEK